jgi:DNA-binding MarR family transcriptional regulator
MEFGTLRDLVDVSDSVMSKQLAVLMSAGYVTTDREVRDSRSRVWATLTPLGRTAFQGHVRALRELAAPPDLP